MKRCSVLTTGELATDHVTALERLHGPVTVDRRCEDLAELIAVSRTVRAEAVLIVGETQKVTSAVLTGFFEQRLKVVAVSDVAAERSRLAALGALTFNDDVHAAQLAEALAEGRPSTDHRGPYGKEAPRDAEFTELLESQGMLEYAAPDSPFSGRADHPHAQGAAHQASAVLTVWGASGSPGRTTLAVNMAAELASSDARTLLIDADTYGAAVAVHLGLMHESAGLAQACRAADLARLDTGALSQAVTPVPLGAHTLDVLTGLPRAERWTELRAPALESVLTQARAEYDHVIIDTSPWIEYDDELALDSSDTAPQRNTATRVALAQADKVLAVGGADPVGFARLVKAVQEFRELFPDLQSPEVVVNQVRREIIGRSPRRQLSDAWDQLGGGGSLESFLPWDQSACDAALRSGQVLAETAKDSALRTQVAALVGVEIAPSRRLRSLRSRRRSRRGRRVETPAGKR